ncbi:MAG: DNA polymerase domain-containing protein [Roseiflexaceae bacterium]
MSDIHTPTADDELLFGWDPTPGIVSVWASRAGEALVWRRVGGQVLCERAQFRPWLLAATLEDVAALRPLPEGAPGSERAPCAYRVLDGPDDSYCYLLTARNGRALERTVLEGARRRLGHAIAGLHELEADYYRVGPVEQYLMQTGRVCFRGMRYADLHRLQFDLETTALDPQRGRIFMVALRDSHGLAHTLDAPAPEDEPELIRALCRLIQERDPDVIENHNLFGFDLPFLETRAAAWGLPLELGRRPGPAALERYDEPTGWREGATRARYSLAGRELIDTLDAVRRHDFVARDLPSYRLKAVAQHFGVAASERVYLAGADVYTTYRTSPEQVRRYALDDVAEVDALSQRLLSAPFALAGMAPRRYGRLANAGPAMGILEPLLVRAYLRAGAAPPRPSAERAYGDGRHAGGALHLFATGVAEHVVKADIASMYPSLMRLYAIGPACDHQCALLRLVARLTDLRLAHKQAMREAPPASLERAHHDALQAAMKLLINSAYGYMGAGTMALFADRRAADEVTRRGRETLDQVVAALRSRGVALIEADTDGVYFAVPPGWDEARERALVAEVAAELPGGIRLEYEGRYRAMFSHEVKNYALLTYRGDLIMRGVALRSSRSEPFGERFLQEALRCVLVGDIDGLQRTYRTTVEQLRTRALPADDLATRVRLSKTPQQYQASRSRQREAAYEALLAAGRTTWRAGERVRCYRTSRGGYAWLPDEATDDQPAGQEPGDENQEPRTKNQEPSVTQNSKLKTQNSTPSKPQAPSLKPQDYDIEHYLGVLVTSYAGRLRKAFAPGDFAQLFRQDAQLGLFDQPLADIQPLWIRCPEQV